jgi:peptidoglycan/LPS O-acetylase OafA/YrhL
MRDGNVGIESAEVLTEKLGTSAFASPISGAHWLPLDGLRGIAVLLVLLYHFCAEWPAQTRLSAFVARVSGSGWVGVDIFFALSGFLITGILVRSRGKRGYFKNFYARRSVRIFPLYYGVLALVFVVIPLVHPYRTRGMQFLSEHQIWLWAYLSNLYVVLSGQWCWGMFGHFWSLCVEEHFYLIWPSIVAWLRPRSLEWACWVLVVLAFVSRYFTAQFNSGAYILTTSRMDALAMGGLVYLQLARGSSGLMQLRRVAPVLLLVVVAAVTWLHASTAHAGPKPHFVELREAFLYGLSAVVGTLMLLLAVTPGLLPWQRLFTHPVLRFFGKYSYGLYVFHFILLTLVDAVAPKERFQRAGGHEVVGFMLHTAVLFTISIAIAMASYHFYERPFLKLKRFF